MAHQTNVGSTAQVGDESTSTGDSAIKAEILSMLAATPDKLLPDMVTALREWQGAGTPEAMLASQTVIKPQGGQQGRRSVASIWIEAFGESEWSIDKLPSVLPLAQVTGTSIMLDSQFIGMGNEPPQCPFYTNAGSRCRAGISAFGSHITCGLRSHSWQQPQFCGLPGTQVSRDDIKLWHVFNLQGLRWESEYKREALTLNAQGEACPKEYFKILMLLGCGHPTFAIKDTEVLKACQAIRANICKAAMSLKSASMVSRSWRGDTCVIQIDLSQPLGLGTTRMGPYQCPRMKLSC